MKRKLCAITMAALLLLAGCGAGSGTANENQTAAGAPSGDYTENGGYWDMGMGGEEYFPSPEAPDAPMESGQGSTVYQRPDAKLIRRAELYIQTEQFEQSEAALDQLVTSCGGYFENKSVYGGGRRDAYADRRGEYTVRVPAEKYSQFLSSAGDLGYVTSKVESSEDVGERYYDTEARLKTQRTKQERLLALLEKAETMEDIIALESALSEVEYQIEQYSSELNRYDALVDFSTFQVYLSEVGRVTQEVGGTAPLGARMAAGLRASLQGLVQGVQDFMIWVSYNIFLVVILAAAVAVGVVAGRRTLKRKREKGKPET